ncbi:MAG: hypothetical protein IPL67_04020 [Ignavibacteria bacterium]|nr:hypothetical protein [Ignavibacteria bacterium]
MSPEQFYFTYILKKRFFQILIFILIGSAGASYTQTTRVDDIDITGNDHFTYSDLVLSMVTKKGALFSPEQFTTDLMTIRSRYKNDGYLFVKFNNSGLSYNEDSSLVDITISIDEGQVVTLGKIDINGNTELKDAQILSALNFASGDVLNDKASNQT